MPENKALANVSVVASARSEQNIANNLSEEWVSCRDGYQMSEESNSPGVETTAAMDGPTLVTGYQQFVNSPNLANPSQLSEEEIGRLRILLSQFFHVVERDDGSNYQLSTASTDSEYSQFRESTHAWAVYADNTKKRAGLTGRLVGTLIIVFQLFAYQLFAAEAIEDYREGQVFVTVGHRECLESDGIPDDGENDLQCVADFTSNMDSIVAFFMLAIFMAGDVIQAARSLRNPPGKWGTFFAGLAAIEVVSAFFAAGIAVSYNLFIGEVTDAVEVGVGLLFIRELSQRTYRGLTRPGAKKKQYGIFFLVVAMLVGIGLLMDPICAKIFAGYIQ